MKTNNNVTIPVNASTRHWCRPYHKSHRQTTRSVHASVAHPNIDGKAARRGLTYTYIILQNNCKNNFKNIQINKHPQILSIFLRFLFFFPFTFFWCTTLDGGWLISIRFLCSFPMLSKGGCVCPAFESAPNNAASCSSYVIGSVEWLSSSDLIIMSFV